MWVKKAGLRGDLAKEGGCENDKDSNASGHFVKENVSEVVVRHSTHRLLLCGPNHLTS